MGRVGEDAEPLWSQARRFWASLSQAAIGVAWAQGARSTAVAEEIAAEALARLARTIGAGRLWELPRARAWLWTTIGNLVADHHRRVVRERELHAKVVGGGADDPERPDELVLVTERALAARTALERIATALGGWLDQSSAEYAPAEALSLVLGV